MTLDPNYRNAYYPHGPFQVPRPVKRKVFVSYHHERDQYWFYNFSGQFTEQYEVFENQSLDDEVESDDADYVNRVIREDYIRGSSTTIVLCGLETWKRRYVDWEIASTLHYEHGLLGILLPGTPVGGEGKYYVPARLHDNIQSGYAMWAAWPSSAEELKVFIEKTLSFSRATYLIRNDRLKMRRNLS